MPRLIVIGGGLSGLSAAWELARANIDCTLIEVKPRLGGSIATQQTGGFIFDGGPFILEKYEAWPFLTELGLHDVLMSVGKYRNGDLVIFKAGTQTLVDALVSRLRADVMLRMAVSSLGLLGNGQVGVCLENGLMLEADGVIIAAPARYAEHMLRTLAPDAAELLMDYQYDPVARICLGYRRADLPDLPMRPEGSLFRFVESYTFPERVPDDQVWVRAGVRLNIDPAVDTPTAALAAVCGLMPAVVPTAEWATYWPEDFPLTRALPEFQASLESLYAALPPRIMLVGSDYRAKRLDQQVEQARMTARRMAALLNSAGKVSDTPPQQEPSS